MATTMRFLILGDDRASASFDRFAAAVARANLAIDKNTTSANKNQSAWSKVDNKLKEMSRAGGAFAWIGLLGPSLIPVLAEATAGVAALTTSLGGAAIGAGAFGVMAKTVLTEAGKDAQKYAALQTKLTDATTAKQKAAAQLQIKQFTAGWAPAYRQLVVNLGGIESQWKKMSQAVATPALSAWLGAVNTGMRFLRPVVKPVADVFRQWGQDINLYFSSARGSAEIQRLATEFGKFSASQLKAIGSFIVDIGSGVHSLGHYAQLYGVDFGSFGKHLDHWGASFAAWSKSDRARQLVMHMLQWFRDNRAVVTRFLQDIGKLLPGAFAGLTAAGQLELRLITDFMDIIAKLPVKWQKILVEGLIAIGLALKAWPLISGTIKGIQWLTGAKGAAALAGAGAAGGGGAGGGALAGAAAGGAVGRGTRILRGAGGELLIIVGAGQIAGATAPSQGAAGLRQYRRGEPGILQPIMNFLFGGEQNAANVEVGLKRWFDANLSDQAIGAALTGPFKGPGVRNAMTDAGRQAILNFVQGHQAAWDKAEKPWLSGRGASMTAETRSVARAIYGRGQQAVTGMQQGMQNRWPGAAAYLRGRGPQVTRETSLVANAMRGRGTQMIAGFHSAASNRWTGAAAWLRGRDPAARTASQNLGNQTLFQKGVGVINGLWDGLRSVWPRLTGWVSGIAGWIKAHKGPVSLDASLLRPAGAALMGGLYDGLIHGWKKVWTLIGGVATKIKDALLGGSVSASGPLVNYAKKLLAAYGWGSQFAALNALIMGESGWNVHATNPTSGAYGIPQALPAGKMASAGADWRTSGYTQLRWMMGYLKAVYGSPARAYAMWSARSPHWYAGGGPISEPVFGFGSRSGRGYAFGEAGPEYVIGRDALDMLAAILAEMRVANMHAGRQAGRTAAGVARAVTAPYQQAARLAALGGG